jgi:phenylpropionate dioxygenase-like ring-hydroxylating dioxygenase large terminal subunit
MDRGTQIALARRILRFIDENTTELTAAPYVNPVSTYTSSAQLERERVLLFRNEPLLVGLSSDAGEPGAYFTRTDTDVPILVVRSRSGRLNAFVDICRHRGARVVSGSGRSSGRFTCPYHGWTYDHDGQVVFQPCREGFTGLPAETLGLKRLPVAERHGMIFVRATAGDPIALDGHLAGAERELAPLGLERYVCFARHETERAINWKLAVDTFLEAYHVPTLHDRSLAPTILGCAAWDAFGRSGRLVVARRSVADLRHRPEEEWSLLEHAVVLWCLFPNTVLIHQIDHVEVVQAYPGSAGAGSARIVFSLYTPEPATDERVRRHFQANFDLLVETVQNEDFRVCEDIQRGFHVAADASVVYGRNEPGLAHYHRMIKATLGIAGTDPAA